MPPVRGDGSDGSVSGGRGLDEGPGAVSDGAPGDGCNLDPNELEPDGVEGVPGLVPPGAVSDGEVGSGSAGPTSDTLAGGLATLAPSCMASDCWRPERSTTKTSFAPARRPSITES